MNRGPEGGTPWRIEVAGRGNRFTVTVMEEGSATEHTVTASDEDLARLGSGYARPQEFIRASFEFLLAREPKERILPEFDVGVISRYFPEYEREIAR